MKNNFNSFENLVELWDYECLKEEIENNIQNLFNKHGVILFFTKDDEPYGCPEDSRLVFAKLKDEPDEFYKSEAKFPAINLLKAIYGTPEDSIERVFGYSDLPKIKVCDQDAIVKMIMNHESE